ncbi:MAG TPA: hypothetical protein VEK08_19670 [Planctomycetota bacterium]|nr:hypothetical protein [Planctomycetota bacterium]
MLLRRLKPEADRADTVKALRNDNQAAASGTTERMAQKPENAGSRKPSERFMRKPLQARSRASNSERFRVADLVSELEKKQITDGILNGCKTFKGYRPGHQKPPGS